MDEKLRDDPLGKWRKDKPTASATPPQPKHEPEVEEARAGQPETNGNIREPEPTTNNRETVAENTRAGGKIKFGFRDGGVTTGHYSELTWYDADDEQDPTFITLIFRDVMVEIEGGGLRASYKLLERDLLGYIAESDLKGRTPGKDEQVVESIRITMQRSATSMAELVRKKRKKEKTENNTAPENQTETVE